MQPDTTLYRELRADAREWWYHSELRQRGAVSEARKREHDMTRRSIQSIRATIENGGWLQIGRGGSTLHVSPQSTISGLHPHFKRACILAGIPTLDSTGIPVDAVYKLAVNGPMSGFADDPFGTDPDSSLSYRHWTTIFDRYARCEGAVLHNYPTTTEA